MFEFDAGLSWKAYYYPDGAAYHFIFNQNRILIISSCPQLRRLWFRAVYTNKER